MYDCHYKMVAFNFLKKKKKSNLPLPSLPNHHARNVAKRLDLSHLPELSFDLKPKADKEHVPVFISVQDYNKIVHETKVIRAKLLESGDYLDHLDKIKALYENELEKLRNLLEKSEKKISTADKLISK